MVDSLAIRSAIFTRRFSRSVSSSANKVSMTSSALASPPGEQAQVDFAQFQLQFTDEPAVTRIVWLFSFVLGFSRLIWGRYVLHQDMQTLLRCHMAAFEAQ